MEIIDIMPPNYVTIADANFREFLKEELPTAFNDDSKMDANHELVKKTIDLTVTAGNIASLEGIEFFTSITGLYCEKNKLTCLDLKKNATLTRLWCSSNQLKSLELPQNAHLETLDCSSNQLTRLNLGENTSLKSLYCQQNSLTSLDLTGCASLSRLSIGVGAVVDGAKKNLIVRLNINEALKNQKEIKEAKAQQATSIIISTYHNDGTLVCPNYNPLSGRCNARKLARLAG